MIKFYSYDSLEPGPRLAVMGAVHGDEVCGSHALRRIMANIDRGALVLLKGSLLAIPVANPLAYEKNIRFTEENLNRVYVESSTPSSYEHKLAQVLMKELAGCDALVDLHSIHTKGWPFAMHFGFFSEAEESLIQSLGLPYIVEGWEEAYMASLPALAGQKSQHSATFMHRRGKIAAGVECGEHADPLAVDVAESVILRAMNHLGIIDVTLPPPPPPQRVRMKKVFMKQNAEGVLKQDFIHGQPIKRGDVLAVYPDGTIAAEEDGMILFPRPACPINEEWFYTGHLI